MSFCRKATFSQYSINFLCRLSFIFAVIITQKQWFANYLTWQHCQLVSSFFATSKFHLHVIVIRLLMLRLLLFVFSRRRYDIVIVTLHTCYHYSLYLMRCMTAKHTHKIAWFFFPFKIDVIHSFPPFDCRVGCSIRGWKFTSKQFRTLQFQFDGCHWALESRSRQLNDALNKTSKFQQKRSDKSTPTVRMLCFRFDLIPNHQAPQRTIQNDTHCTLYSGAFVFKQTCTRISTD